jgi:hypothetical protein
MSVYEFRPSDAAVKLATIRAEMLFNFYRERRREGIDPITANELMGKHAQWLDDLELVKTEMEKAS